MTILSNIANEVIVLRTLICREVKSFNKNIKEIDTGIIDVGVSIKKWTRNKEYVKNIKCAILVKIYTNGESFMRVFIKKEKLLSLTKVAFL